MINELAGKWYLLYSTFPMWQKSGVRNVTFNYTPITKDGEAVLEDKVKYLKGNTEKVISGYDYPDKEETGRFTWRGKGLLMLLSSNWKVEWQSPNKDCVVLSFKKTLVTPAGLDIICRDAIPNVFTIEQAQQFIATQSHLKVYEESLKPVVV